jgi:ATP phosphoribosyltransferase
VPLEHMHDISSRLIANKASWKMKHARIVELMEQLREAVEKRNG